jgi:hypothetical protein
MVSERVANASRDTLVREPAGAPERSAGFFFSPRDWRGASVPRFLVSLTELQSYVTRKTPALNNAKPERTIASIALASVHERSIPSEPKSPRRHRQIPPSRGQQPLRRLGQLTSRGPTRSRSWEQFRLCTSEDAWPPPCVGALIQSAAAKTVPPMRPRRGSGGAAGEAKSLRANPFCTTLLENCSTDSRQAYDE